MATAVTDRLVVTSPATGALAGEVECFGTADVRETVAAARVAGERWHALGFEGRARVLRSARRMLADRAEEAIEVVVSETGKAWEDAQSAEVTFGLLALGFWAGRAEGFLREERRRMRSPLGLGRRASVSYVPYGVVGVISPWNYPLALPLADSLPALMAGNAVVVKPSELTPLSSLWIADLLREAGLPEGVFTVAPGMADVARALIDAADMIAFTGSSATGAKVMERAARTLTPVNLELGGKDAAIVFADADLERAAERCIYYGMLNSGQTCLSIERIYVESSVYDRMLGLLAERVARLRQGPPRGPGTVEVGAMASPTQHRIVSEHLDDALAGGARVLVGGGRGEGEQRFHPPTLLAGVTDSMRCMREETFGPLLPVASFATEAEVIARVNDSEYGLAATVFTADDDRWRRLAVAIEAGTVSRNDPVAHFALMELPMGGWKSSGLGVRHGREGIRKFCRAKTIVELRHGLPREPHLHPFTKRRTTLLLGALKKGFGSRIRRRRNS